MKDKKIVVLLKFFKGELNPFDGAALECALSLNAKEVIALAMAPISALDAMKNITRLGVKCVLISDSAYAGSDTQATSFILSKALERLRADVIFCGRQSVDGDTAQVPPMIAERLGYDIFAKVTDVKDNAFLLRDGSLVQINAKTVYTFEKIATLRFPSMFSRAKEVEIWNQNTLQIPLDKCGLVGSTTRVIKSYESKVGRRFCHFVSRDKLDVLIKEGLKKVNQTKIKYSGEKLSEIYFVGDVKSVAESVGEKAIELSVEGKTAEQIANELKEKKVRAVLWEDNEEYKLLAPKIAVLTEAGICADCISFRVENGELIMTRPAFGGNVTADIVCTGKIAFATVRTSKKCGSDVIFSIGKGAIHKIDDIKSLAKEYSAEVCASRIVVDSGKMPYETQVGLTGRTVSPKVYVAFGIAGAVQHTCAIAGAGTVIAINNDKNARIFDYADYGILEDV